MASDRAFWTGIDLDWESMVDHGMVSGDWQPLVVLLDRILARLEADLEGWTPACLAVAVGHARAPGGTGLVPVASTRGGASLVEAQIEHGGPVVDAVTSGQPVSTANVWRDDRWPSLTRQRINERVPAVSLVLDEIVGVAVVPDRWGDGGSLALSCCLPTPPEQGVLDVMKRYTPMIAASFVVANASITDASEQVFHMLRSRAVIEQAKGAIMGASRCDADSAWTVLRNASQYFNVKLRDLAIALVEHLGDAPAEQSTAWPAITPTSTARRAAQVIWTASTTTSSACR